MNNAEIEQSAIDRFGAPRKLEDIPEEKLRQAVAECKTFAGVRLRLGLGSVGCTNEDVKMRCAEVGIDCGELTSKIAGRWEQYSINELEAFANDSETISDFCQKIGITSIGHARNLLSTIIERSTVIEQFLRVRYIRRSENNTAKWANFSFDEMSTIVRNSSTYREVAEKLGYNSDPTISHVCRELGIDTSHIDNRIKDNMLASLCANNELSRDSIMRALRYVRDVSQCEHCGCSEHNGYPISLQAHHKNGIHDDNRIENIAVLCPTCHAFIENRAVNPKNFLPAKKAVIDRDGWICSQCGISEIDGALVPLELHHKDGNHQNHDLTNLDLRCPNCHSQSENWGCYNEHKHYSEEEFIKVLKESRSKNEAAQRLGIRAGKAFYQKTNQLADKYGIVFEDSLEINRIKNLLPPDVVTQVILLLETTLSYDEIRTRTGIGITTISKINLGLHPNCPLNKEYPIRHKSPRKRTKNKKSNCKSNLCQECGTEITSSATHCKSCQALLQRKVERPDRDTLIELLRYYNLRCIGKQYGVSDNAVRKWCKSYNLPYRRHDIRRFFENPCDVFTEDMSYSYTEQDLIDAYKAYGSLKKAAAQLHCDSQRIRVACEKHGITFNMQQKNAIPVIAIDKTTGCSFSFSSQYDARDWILENDKGKSRKGVIRHIMNVIKEEQKTAYGYYWKIQEK